MDQLRYREEKGLVSHMAGQEQSWVSGQPTPFCISGLTLTMLPGMGQDGEMNKVDKCHLCHAQTFIRGTHPDKEKGSRYRLSLIIFLYHTHFYYTLGGGEIIIKYDLQFQN